MKRIFVLLFLCAAQLWSLSAATIRVGVLLPLKEKTDRGTTFVEFYQGLLMAVEQMKDRGTNVEVIARDCGSSDAHLQQILSADTILRHVDVLFGPVDAVQVTPLSEFCRQHQIRMVVPFNTPCPQVYSNPFVYQVGVAQELLYPGITKLLIDNLSNSNFVFYNSGEQDARGAGFVAHISQVLSLRNMQSTQLAAGADESAFDLAFNQFRENVVVLDSRSQKALTQMLAAVKTYQQQHPQYKISLLGYPEWLSYASSLQVDFYQFDTRIFSSYFRNPLSGKVVKFDQRYQLNFNRAMHNTFPRATLLGYDLGLYFMQGILELGDQFDSRQGELKQQPLQHTFGFQRVGEEGGFVNLHVQLVHYSSNKTIQIVQ